jgi:hypothetical protein
MYAQETRERNESLESDCATTLFLMLVRLYFLGWYHQRLRSSQLVTLDVPHDPLCQPVMENVFINDNLSIQ